MAYRRRMRVEPLEDRRLLAVVTVNTDQDVVDLDDGLTSLREAIFATNITPGADEIVFDLGHNEPATILLTLGELKITDSLTITGLGAELLTIDASGNDPTPEENNGDGSRVFTIDDGTADRRDIVMSGMTITGGDVSGSLRRNGWGGGILSYLEDLEIRQCVITGNSSQNPGGGIAAIGGRFLLSESTVSNNSTRSWGGGIYNGSLARIANSTISGNTAGRSGGGLFSYEAPFEMLHSTLTGNRAGALYFGRGGGVAYGTDVGDGRDSLMEHCIVAGNTLGNGQLYDVHGGISARNSLIGAVEPFFGIIDRGGNQIGSINQPLDARLGPLQDNGGPTPTHALLPGSLAINAGDPAFVAGVGDMPEFDQRGPGFGRVFAGRIDLGAFELQSFVVDTLVDENDGDYSPGDFSLREALAQANARSGADKIEFAPDLASGTILLTMGELAVTDSVEVVGLGAELLTVDASGNDPTPDENNGDGSRLFSVDDRDHFALIDVAISDLKLTGGDERSRGGAIYTSERLAISRLSIGDNSSGTWAGGIYNSRGTLSISGTTLEHNMASNGGAIFSTGATITIADSIIRENAATDGGGISVTDTSLFVTNCSIQDNSGILGGGLRLFDSVLRLSDSTVSNNNAIIEGGGVLSFETNTLVLRSTISGNTSNGDGGGLWSVFGNLNIVESTLSANSARREGGGICVPSGSLSVSRSLVSENSTTYGGGGGIFTWASAIISDSEIRNNTAGGDGGGVQGFNNTLTITRSRISDNHSDDNGGGLRSYRAIITNSTISGNTAGGSGGGIYGSTSYIHASTISGNIAFINGGGVNAQSDTSIVYSTVAENLSSGAGGGIFLHGGSLTLDNSIIATNIAPSGTDATGLIGSAIVAHSSLVGNAAQTGLTPAPIGSPDANGNLIGTSFVPIYPLLAPLSDNGGPTLTHALLPGSPAINAGDPTLVPGMGDTPEFDQRGAPFARVYGGRIDIGAFEVQPIPTAGDFDGDGDVDGRDFLAWQRNASMGNLEVWQEQYGESQELRAEGGEPARQESRAESREQDISDLGFMSDVNVRETASDVGALFEDSYVEEVDRALEQLATAPAGVRSFGEMVARRGKLSRARAFVGD